MCTFCFRLSLCSQYLWQEKWSLFLSFYVCVCVQYYRSVYDVLAYTIRMQCMTVGRTVHITIVYEVRFSRKNIFAINVIAVGSYSLLHECCYCFGLCCKQTTFFQINEKRRAKRIIQCIGELKTKMKPTEDEKKTLEEEKEILIQHPQEA